MKTQRAFYPAKWETVWDDPYTYWDILSGMA